MANLKCLLYSTTLRRAVARRGWDFSSILQENKPTDTFNSTDKSSMRALLVISSACKGRGEQLTLENHLPGPQIRTMHADRATSRPLLAQMSRLLVPHGALPHPWHFSAVTLPTVRCASNKISGNQIKGKNLSWIKRRRSVGRNRDVKVNVKWEKDQCPSLWGAGFMRQARTGQRFLWKAMNRVPWEPTVCLLSVFSVLTHRQSG